MHDMLIINIALSTSISLIIAHVAMVDYHIDSRKESNTGLKHAEYYHACM